ncbi:MAG TPA: TIGR01212 family radical SAM protein [Synergistaceae bacterium]|nr:TIGR01212 family radical SAM protein [Synergistaceae bacterium]
MASSITYTKWSSLLREEFGTRVHKISLDLGAGCPHREGLRKGGCIFCDYRGGGSGAALQGISLEEQVRRGAFIAQNRFKAKKGILYFQSYSASNLPLPLLKEKIEKALHETSLHLPIVGLALGTRPDLVPEDFFLLLEEYMSRGLAVWLELGIQTTQEEGLLFLRRGHTLEAVEEALQRASSRPSLRLCAHLIAGIPGEPADQLLRSVRWLISRKVYSFKFHPLHVLRGTPLEKLYEKEEFTPLSLQEYARRVAEVLLAEPEIVVQRLSADAHPSFLVAPEWMKDKNKVLQCIEKNLANLG